jgi:hypothetical protein
MQAWRLRQATCDRALLRRELPLLRGGRPAGALVFLLPEIIKHVLLRGDRYALEIPPRDEQD